MKWSRLSFTLTYSPFHNGANVHRLRRSNLTHFWQLRCSFGFDKVCRVILKQHSNKYEILKARGPNCENLKADRPTSFCPDFKFSQIEPIFEYECFGRPKRLQIFTTWLVQILAQELRRDASRRALLGHLGTWESDRWWGLSDGLSSSFWGVVEEATTRTKRVQKTLFRACAGSSRVPEPPRQTENDIKYIKT